MKWELCPKIIKMSILLRPSDRRATWIPAPAIAAAKYCQPRPIQCEEQVPNAFLEIHSSPVKKIETSWKFWLNLLFKKSFSIDFFVMPRKQQTRPLSAPKQQAKRTRSPSSTASSLHNSDLKSILTWPANCDSIATRHCMSCMTLGGNRSASPIWRMDSPPETIWCPICGLVRIWLWPY